MELEKTFLIQLTHIQKDQHGMYSLISEYHCKAKDDELIVHEPREPK